MGAAQYDVEAPGGGTIEFIVDIVGGPADLTGYVGSMMIRELRSDLVPLQVLDSGNFTVNPATRQVTVRIPSSITSGWTWERGVYDAYLTGPGTDAWRFVEGRITNSFAVTRS